MFLWIDSSGLKPLKTTEIIVQVESKIKNIQLKQC